MVIIIIIIIVIQGLKGKETWEGVEVARYWEAIGKNYILATTYGTGGGGGRGQPSEIMLIDDDSIGGGREIKRQKRKSTGR